MWSHRVTCTSPRVCRLRFTAYSARPGIREHLRDYGHSHFSFGRRSGPGARHTVARAADGVGARLPVAARSGRDADARGPGPGRSGSRGADDPAGDPDRYPQDEHTDAHPDADADPARLAPDADPARAGRYAAAAAATGPGDRADRHPVANAESGGPAD